MVQAVVEQMIRKLEHSLEPNQVRVPPRTAAFQMLSACCVCVSQQEAWGEKSNGQRRRQAPRVLGRPKWYRPCSARSATIRHHVALPAILNSLSMEPAMLTAACLGVQD